MLNRQVYTCASVLQVILHYFNLVNTTKYNKLLIKIEKFISVAYITKFVVLKFIYLIIRKWNGI